MLLFVVFLTFARIIKSVVTGQAPVTLEQLAEECPRENTQTSQRWHTHVYAIHASARNIKKVKSGVSLRCARSILVHAYVSLLPTGKDDYAACYPRKTTTYILHVVPITTHTHVTRKSIGKTKQRKEKRKERKGKKRKGSEKGKEKKENTKQQQQQENIRQEEEARKGKEKKMSY